LEHAFGDADMLALAARFEAGRLSARDCVAVIAAGLRGAGYEITDGEVAAMRSEAGAAGYVDVVARLLQATFGGGAASDGGTGGEGPRGPFPGTR
jgi:hypothetical protein